jgi:hypothetical protein
MYKTDENDLKDGCKRTRVERRGKEMYEEKDPTESVLKVLRFFFLLFLTTLSICYQSFWRKLRLQKCKWLKETFFFYNCMYKISSLLNLPPHTPPLFPPPPSYEHQIRLDLSSSSIFKTTLAVWVTILKSASLNDILLRQKIPLGYSFANTCMSTSHSSSPHQTHAWC